MVLSIWASATCREAWPARVLQPATSVQLPGTLETPGNPVEPRNPGPPYSLVFEQAGLVPTGQSPAGVLPSPTWSGWGRIVGAGPGFTP